MDLCHLKTKISEVQRTCCASRSYCEGWLWSLCSVHWTRLVCFTNDCSKSHGCHWETTRLWWTSSWRNTCVYTQVKSEGAPKLLRIPKSECPDFWIRIPRNRWPKSWSNLEDPVLPLERNLYGHPLAGLLWERKARKNLIGSWIGKKYRIGNAYLAGKKTRFILVSIRGRYQHGWKEGRNWWKKLILTNQHHFSIMCTLDALSATANRTTIDIMQQHNEMSESHISAGATENYLGGTNFMQKPWLGPTTLKDMLKKNVWKGTANWRKRRQSNFAHFPVLAWMITNSRRKIWNQLENCQKFAHKLFSKCLYIARIGRPDIPCSVNKLAPSGTKWTQGCDKRLARFDIIHSSHKKLSSMLSCGKCSTSLLIGLISRLRRWLWALNIRRNLMYFRMSYICLLLLDE